MQDFRKLEVWNQGRRLTQRVYELTNHFPKDEMYGLTSQIRRAAVSIIANIAEGCGRQSDADFARFLHMAMGSGSELECLLILAHDLGYLSEVEATEVLELTASTRRILNGLIQSVERSLSP